ncbi:unnamed protein product [Pelagomonas calceolata]|uniref:Uncharacterized protein n=2 Tax=Pelagomonas calceolata TaxID=35677 RepID=A0A8J2SSL5_9STRA|nr:unnamed protein product [Pelagomonas calceolata]
MPKPVTEDEKRQRKETALAVLRDAGPDDFQTLDAFHTRVGESFGASVHVGRSVCLEALKTLPSDHVLRQRYAAIKERSQSSSAKSAAAKVGQIAIEPQSLDEARADRQSYAEARRGLSTGATAERLRRELDLASKAMAVSVKAIFAASRECACNTALAGSVESFEEGVGLVTCCMAVNTPVNAPVYVRTAFVEYAGERADQFFEKRAAAIREEEETERRYQAATQPGQGAFPGRYDMASTIAASGVDGRGVAALRVLDPKDLEPLYLQALAVKDKRPSRGAKTKGDDARHAKAGDAYTSLHGVLRPPAVLAREPGWFARTRDRGLAYRGLASDEREEKIEKIADALELDNKLLFSKRAVVMPERASATYGRLAPTPLDSSKQLQLAKKVAHLGRGRFMLAAIRANGEPILIVAGRGMCMDMHVGIPPPPVKAADAETRLRTRTTVANSHDLLQRYDRGAAQLMAALRRVIIKMKLSGADVAVLVDRILDQIDGRCEDVATGAAPTRGAVPMYDSEDEGTLGQCPPGVDEEDWAVLKKGEEAGSFARLALASDFAAAASSLLGKLRAAGPNTKCGGVDASEDVEVPAGGEAPPDDQAPPPPPRGAKRGKKMPPGEEAGPMDWITSFAPLEFDWVVKADVERAPAWAKPIGEDNADERLLDFWLRFSRGMAASIPKFKYVVLNPSNAAAADVQGLVKAVDECAAERKAADATDSAPAAKRPRLVEA